jgi:hypothetical protein
VLVLASHNQLLLWLASQPSALTYASQLPDSADLYSSAVIRGSDDDYYILQSLAEPTHQRAFAFLKVYGETKRNPGPGVAYPNLSDDEVARRLAEFPKVNKAKTLANEPLSIYVHADGKYSILVPL